MQLVYSLQYIRPRYYSIVVQSIRCRMITYRYLSITRAMKTVDGCISSDRCRATNRASILDIIRHYQGVREY